MEQNKTSTIAICAIIFSILFFPIGFILGIIGIVQHKKFDKTSKILSIISVVLSSIPILLIWLVGATNNYTYGDFLNAQYFGAPQVKTAEAVFRHDADSGEEFISVGCYGTGEEMRSCSEALNIAGPLGFGSGYFKIVDKNTLAYAYGDSEIVENVDFQILSKNSFKFNGYTFKANNGWDVLFSTMMSV